MKYTFILPFLFTLHSSFAQLRLPVFLQGTWKNESKEMYEHWDIINEHEFKGFSYTLNDGQMSVSEYLEIIKSNNEIIYSATVIHQNQGKTIHFKQTQSDSIFIFENVSHDFPKKIVYQKLNDSEMYVQVSGAAGKGFSYRMRKQIPEVESRDSNISNPRFNKKLAQKLGGDEYGMKSYYWVILKTGSDTTSDKKIINESFEGHMNNINRLVDEGILIVAGPLKKNDNKYRGIFILNNLNSIEAVKEVLQTDPAIKNKLLSYEIYTWYGSAALPEYLPFSDKIWKVKP